MINLAQRADNHNYRFDPIVRSLLDTDFYKILMLQFIYFYFPKTHASFKVINRSIKIPLATIVSINELQEQLDYVSTLSFTESELVYLAGNKFYGRRDIFYSDFINFLRTVSLKTPRIEVVDNQFEIHFEGLWIETMLWEIYVLSILNELKSRAGFRNLNKMELDVFYSRAVAKNWDKVSKLKGIPGFKVAEFGTRRRHSFLWQEKMLMMSKSILGDALVGTSNVFLAMKHSMEAIGTNAHELTMVITALADIGKIDCSILNAPYKVLEMWQELYQGNLLIFLPDTYGTTGFLENAPDFVWKWTGMRADSKNPYDAGEEYISNLLKHNIDPKDKMILFSDGLDVDEMIKLHAQFGGIIQPGYTINDFNSVEDFLDQKKWKHEPRIKVSFGWGTMMSNDMKNCNPKNDDIFNPISIVCKVDNVEGQKAVKLSDNWNKSTGDKETIERYRKIFGTKGVENIQVNV